MTPSPPCSRPSANSCTRRRPSAVPSASPLISPRSRSDCAKPDGPTWIRLLALAYPAITKSRPKNASILIHTAWFWSKVRLPNFSWEADQGARPWPLLSRVREPRTRRRALEHSADYAAASAADSGSGSSRTLRIMPSALCFCGRLFG